MEEKKYWKGIEELTNDTEFIKSAQNEFPEFLPIKEQRTNGEGSSRRDFLKLMGFSVAAASLAACEAPVKKAIPYLNAPDNIDLTAPNFYATTYVNGADYCSILVKTRDGRPIKVEGNRLSAVSKGATSAKAQASVLSLYDTERYTQFKAAGKEAKIEVVDKAIVAKLTEAKAIRLVTHSIISPSTKAVIADFLKKYPSAEVVTYDAISASGILDANGSSFGVRVIPSYDFSKADVIVSFSADFLGTWLSPIEFSRQYAKTRKLSKDKKEMSKHYQFETALSLTGANADVRTPLKPSQLGTAVAALYDKITGKDTKFGDAKVDQILDKAAKDLKAAAGKSLVVCGSNDESVQVIINAINDSLANYGSTIDLNTYSNLQQGDDEEMIAFVEDIKSGKVDAVIFYNTNPVYDHPKGKEIAESLKKVGTKISLADRPDETAVLCDFNCPDLHYLEAWNDAEPKKGFFSLAQPTISPLFKTRAAQESLLIWAGLEADFYTYLRKFWKDKIYAGQKKYNDFEEFWTSTLHDGIFESGATVSAAPVKENKDAKDKDKKDTKEPVVAVAAGKFKGDVNAALAAVGQNYKATSTEIELVIYEKIAIGNEKEANNPWLQEMPDPISKVCWDNYAAIAPKTAKDKDLQQGDIVAIKTKSGTIELPVLLQPGQAAGTVAVALGYGRANAGKVANEIGKNAYPLVGVGEANLNYYATGVTLTKTSNKAELAQTQTQNTIMGRAIVQESTLAEYAKNPGAGRFYPKVATSEGLKKPTEITLWKGHKYNNHSWGLVIDLNACIGCGACTIACQAENNVPVVGKKEIGRSRDMHWIRIDRYYSSDGADKDYAALEIASENPEVTFMPMMCQHCNNAPCETVCPVLATTHSSEGLNQMAYNRCIGTRYCANNCPFKVRRFNWFHYAEDDRFTAVNYSQTTDLGKMVLNPEVTVRSRGVMEKCTLCVQRIQAGKLDAKRKKKKVQDGDFTVACAQACPTEAIIFGDMNDEVSLISKTMGIKQEVKKGKEGKEDEVEYKITEPRAYHVLEELNVRPQISYLTKIRNKESGAKKTEKKA